MPYREASVTELSLVPKLRIFVAALACLAGSVEIREHRTPLLSGYKRIEIVNRKKGESQGSLTPSQSVCIIVSCPNCSSSYP